MAPHPTFRHCKSSPNLGEPLKLNVLLFMRLLSNQRPSSRYYGFLFFANLVKDFGEDAKIAPVLSLDGPSVVHYAIYSSDSKTPQKLVIMNLEFSNATIARQQRTFDVSPALGQQVKVTRLTGPSSDATSGISWAGQTVDGEGSIVGVETYEYPADGVVSVGSSEAVIVEKA